MFVCFRNSVKLLFFQCVKMRIMYKCKTIFFLTCAISLAFPFIPSYWTTQSPLEIFVSAETLQLVTKRLRAGIQYTHLVRNRNY